LFPDVVKAGKDGISVIDTSGRFIHWGLDKGYRDCSTIDKPTQIPWLSESTRNNSDYIDIGYGLDHLMILRKQKGAT
jgi:hypothetical protein